jgi:metal-sulfur cluster biosynthetic enzyme
MIVPSRIEEALARVRDPELDQSITELGFVEDLEIEGDSVRVRLRLPTYWCAPNFAYLMAADAKEAVGELDDVASVEIDLIDHFASSEINEGLVGEKTFEETFPGDSIPGGLSDLRDLFRRKGFISRQEKLCRSLLASGVDDADLARLTVGDLPPNPETELYLERRLELGLDTSPHATFLVTADGKPIPEGSLNEHRRFARTVGVSIEANAGLCRALLETRYGIKPREEATA